MSGWPTLDRADDRRLAISLRAGDADALPQIFDGYAARLYDYCHALLRDQQYAAEALKDTLLAAQAHIGLLSDEEWFRGWLYALARNACLRRLQDPGRTGERHEAPEVDNIFLDPEERARQQEMRQVVHSALAGLSGREREAIDLLMRHDLHPEEIAGVLGISSEDAAELAVQARARLDDALAASVIARTARADCPSVAALVEDWEWPLTAAVCRKLIRHIETCPTCSELRKRKVSTARLLQVLPVALLPAECRSRVLVAATDPEFAAERGAAAEQAGAFTEWGWPVPVERPVRRVVPQERRDPPKLWPALAIAALVVLIVAGAFVWLPGASDNTGAVATPSSSSPAASDPDEEPTTDPPSTSSSPSPSPSTPTPSPTTSSRSPSASPTSRSPKPRRTTPKPTAPAKGTLSVSGCAISKTESSCTITVSAAGGRVNWSVTSTSGGVSASGGGHMDDGYSVPVVASRPGTCPAGTKGGGSVSFSPNGSASVTWTCPDAPQDPPGQG